MRPTDRAERERKERATERRNWPVAKYRLGEEPSEDLSETTTAGERLGMMWQLAQDAWAMAGREIPDTPRSEWPITVRRLHDPPEEPFTGEDRGVDR